MLLTSGLPGTYTVGVTHVVRCRTFRNLLLIVIVGGPVLGGCSMLSWLGLGDSQDSSQQTADTTSPEATGAFLFDNTSSNARPTVRVIDLAFDVARIDFPVDTVRHSRKVWNHVDEMRVDSDRVSRLARNGLRVGVASAEAWDAIRAIVRAADADVRQDRFVAQRGTPLTIKLSSIEEPESIFSYSPEGRLVGKTFTEGDKLLNMDYIFHSELGGSTDLELDIEIRRDPGAMAWQRQGGIIRQVPAYDRHVFADLRIPLTLHTDETLIVGLSDQEGNEYLLGSRFLMFKRLDKRYETVLCITPRHFQTQGGKGGP